MEKKSFQFQFRKLVRSKVTQHLQEQGVQIHSKRLNPTEHASALCEKLLEEASEVKNAKTKKELIEEIADMYEALDALLEVNNISLQEVEQKKKAKQQERGDFMQAEWVDWIEIPNKPTLQSYIDYYQKNMDRYPVLA